MYGERRGPVRRREKKKDARFNHAGEQGTLITGRIINIRVTERKEEKILYHNVAIKLRIIITRTVARKGEGRDELDRRPNTARWAGEWVAGAFGGRWQSRFKFDGLAHKVRARDVWRTRRTGMEGAKPTFNLSRFNIYARRRWRGVFAV